MADTASTITAVTSLAAAGLGSGAFLKAWRGWLDLKTLEIAGSRHGEGPAPLSRIEIADLLAQDRTCAAEWADWWGGKMELFDGIQENIALTDLPAQSCAIVHSDSAEGIQRLNQEAGKAMARGTRAGLSLPPERAIRWLTSNPAHALGIDGLTGTLEAGKMGDEVVWNGNPLSVYALAEQVFIDGALVYDREHPPARPRSDFLLGQPGAGVQP